LCEGQADCDAVPARVGTPSPDRTRNLFDWGCVGSIAAVTGPNTACENSIARVIR
jgi:hypothetical protein